MLWHKNIPDRMYLGFQVIVDNLIITYVVKTVNTEVVASWCWWISTCPDKSIITPVSSICQVLSLKPSATAAYGQYKNRIRTTGLRHRLFSKKNHRGKTRWLAVR